jgi:hypothetical protein
MVSTMPENISGNIISIKTLSVVITQILMNSNDSNDAS